MIRHHSSDPGPAPAEDDPVHDGTALPPAAGCPGSPGGAVAGSDAAAQTRRAPCDDSEEKTRETNK